MKIVIYSEWETVETEHGRRLGDLKEKGEAEFLQFGLDFDHFDNGVGNYSTAILKLDNGTVKNIPVENIRFID